MGAESEKFFGAINTIAAIALRLLALAAVIAVITGGRQIDPSTTADQWLIVTGLFGLLWALGLRAAAIPAALCSLFLYLNQP